MLRVFSMLLLLLAAAPGTAQPCRQGLALALDVSGSVDSSEYTLQMHGLAAALDSPDVRAALLGTPGPPVHLAIFEWSGETYQKLLVPWTAINDAQSLDPVIQTLLATTRTEAPPGTALGSAMRFGAGLLAQRSACWQRTLDISGDGKHNLGPHPRDVRAMLAGSDLTVNALVIGADTPGFGDTRLSDVGELTAYFRAWVTLGSDSFVETALGFDDYQAAMTRKLIRELQGLILSAAPAR